MATEHAADMFVQHPQYAAALGWLAEQVCLLYYDRPDAQRAAAGLWEACTRYAPAAKSWVSRYLSAALTNKLTLVHAGRRKDGRA